MDPYEKVPPGSIVVCTYRMPSVIQPWIHPIRVGAVEMAGDDPLGWNGKNSERSYCELTGKVRVAWQDDSDDGTVVNHDTIDSLIVLTPAEIAMSNDEKVRYFLGEIAYRNLCRSRKVSHEAEATV